MQLAAAGLSLIKYRRMKYIVISLHNKYNLTIIVCYSYIAVVYSKQKLQHSTDYVHRCDYSPNRIESIYLAVVVALNFSMMVLCQ